jgi:hypothetical protein
MMEMDGTEEEEAGTKGELGELISRLNDENKC